MRSKIGGIGGSKQRSSDALGANFSTATYRVYKKLVGACEAKLGELVDIGSYFFNGNIQGIQKLDRAYEAKLGELVETRKDHRIHRELLFQRQRTGYTKTRRGV